MYVRGSVKQGLIRNVEVWVAPVKFVLNLLNKDLFDSTDCGRKSSNMRRMMSSLDKGQKCNVLFSLGIKGGFFDYDSVDFFLIKFHT